MRDTEARKRIEELESHVGHLELDLLALERRLRIQAEDDAFYLGWGLDSKSIGLPVEDVIGRILRHLGLRVQHIRDWYTLEAVPDAKKRK